MIYILTAYIFAIVLTTVVVVGLTYLILLLFGIQTTLQVLIATYVAMSIVRFILSTILKKMKTNHE